MRKGGAWTELGDPAALKLMSLFRDFSAPAVVAGFVTVLVGFTSSAVIVFAAAQALRASPAEVASWMWALGLGMGLTCIGLSLRYGWTGLATLVLAPFGAFALDRRTRNANPR